MRKNLRSMSFITSNIKIGYISIHCHSITFIIHPFIPLFLKLCDVPIGDSNGREGDEFRNTNNVISKYHILTVLSLRSNQDLEIS